MTHSITVIALAVAAAACFGASYVVEQRKSSEAPPQSSMKVDLLVHLAREPLWWLAVLVDLGGYGFQAWALTIGSVAFVQPIIVLSLPFALIVGHMAGSHRLKATELAWSFVFVAALTAFLVVGDPTAGVARRGVVDWVTPFVLVGAAVGACIVCAIGRSSTARALLLGAGAGMLFGVTSVLTKGVTADLDRGPLSMLGRWEVYALGATALVALLIMSSAFQAGDLRSSLPTLSLGEPLVAVTLGVIVLHEHLDVSGVVSRGVVAVSIPSMIAVAVLLARSAASSGVEIASSPSCTESLGT